MENTAEPKRRKKALKRVFQILFFVALTGIGIFYVLKDDPSKTFSYLGNASFFPLLLALFVLVFTIILDGLSLTLLTKIHNPNYHLIQGIVNVAGGGLIGCYLKTAAPLLQTYIYNKQGVKPGQAASILTMNFLIYQLTLVAYIITVVTMGFQQMSDITLDFLGGFPIVWFGLFGLAFQTSFFLIILSLALNKRIHRFVSNNVVNFFAKIKIIRNPEETRKKLTLRFVTYRIEFKRMFGHKGPVFGAILTMLLKQFLIGIIPFLVIWSLKVDMSKVSFFSTFVGSGYVTTIASYITVGAPEIAFQSIFTNLLSAATANPAVMASATNIIWRSITFYLIFLLGLLTVLLYRGPKEKRSYSFLSSTATIYDLEAIALSENKDDETNEFLSAVQYKPKDKNALPHHKHELLTQEELQDSFARIRETIFNQPMEEKQPEITDEELREILNERKKDLARALQESEKLANQKPDPEIEAATKAEYELTAKKQAKSRERRLARIQKKKQRRMKREKKELEKFQPVGSSVTVNESGINLNGPEFQQVRTLTTCDPEEENKQK